MDLSITSFLLTFVYVCGILWSKTTEETKETSKWLIKISGKGFLKPYHGSRHKQEKTMHVWKNVLILWMLA